jgi:HK97 family phage prohead protease
MKTNAITRPDQETRFFSAAIELRAMDEESDKKKIFGYAAKFNVESENLGSDQYQFREVIMPGAFDEVLADDVRALFNHDPNAILARSKNGEGSLRLGVDSVGLWYEFEAPDTQAGRDLMTSIERGDVDQSSFSFRVAKDGQVWETTRSEEQEITKRTITKVSRLFDVSPVTYPAYPDATVALRSLQDFRSNGKPEETENHSLSHWQRRMGLVSKPAENTK